MLELFIILLLGLVTGVLVGLLPGLPAYLGPLLLFPIIKYLSVDQILAFWLACQIGSQYFGSVAAILLKVPGEASSMIYINDLTQVSSVDRFDLIRQTAWGSTVGSIIGLVVLASVYYIGFADNLIQLTNTNVKLTVLSLLIITLIYVTRHKLISLALFSVGVMLTEKTNQGLPDWIFSIQDYTTDITVFSLILGLLIIPEFIKEIGDTKKNDPLLISKNYIRPVLNWTAMFRGTWIGALVGLIPGPSSILASIVSYNAFKKDDVKQRIIGSESANNSATITSILPFLYIGLPITLSEMILVDIFQVKLFTLPTDALTAWSLFPGINLIEFCFIIIIFYTVCYHFLSQRFLPIYEQLMRAVRGKMFLFYLGLIVYIILIDIKFNPVNIGRYAIFTIMWTGIGYWLARRNINVLPLVFGFILGDMITWTVYHFYLINFF